MFEESCLGEKRVLPHHRGKASSISSPWQLELRLANLRPIFSCPRIGILKVI
jgi:hypothetical protein